MTLRTTVFFTTRGGDAYPSLTPLSPRKIDLSFQTQFYLTHPCGRPDTQLRGSKELSIASSYPLSPFTFYLSPLPPARNSISLVNRT